MKLANRSPAFSAVFAEHCRQNLERGSYFTPEFVAHCRRRLEEEGYIAPEAEYYDPAAPARSATPSAVAQGAQIPPLFSRREIPPYNLTPYDP
eukprot:6570641-Heterocapsa_arctica.AAC.1